MSTDDRDTITLDRGSYTTCTINLHGATVVSWRITNREQLFVSRHAVMDRKEVIRGGIPIIFPHFGPWDFGPKHGFARIVRWNIEKMPERNKNKDVEAAFSLTDDDYTRSMWNFSFKIIYHVVLKERELHFKITVENTDKTFPFDFNILFHTYLRVPDVKNCQIRGLPSCVCVKSIDLNDEDGEVVTIGESSIDCTYCDTSEELIVTKVVGERSMRIQKYNLPDVVVWNPWVENSKNLSHFDSDEYLKMICIEVGKVLTPIKLNPGSTYEGIQIFEVFPRIPPDEVSK